MSDENKKLIRRYQEAYNKGDFERLHEFLAPDWVAHTWTPGIPKSLAATREVHLMHLSACPDLEYTIDDLIAEGDRVVARFTVRGTHLGPLMGFAPTGKRLEVQGISIFRIAGGKIVEHWAVSDIAGLFVQLGAALPSG